MFHAFSYLFLAQLLFINPLLVSISFHNSWSLVPTMITTKGDYLSLLPTTTTIVTNSIQFVLLFSSKQQLSVKQTVTIYYHSFIPEG